jgi:hypothetical protein
MKRKRTASNPFTEELVSKRRELKLKNNIFLEFVISISK